MPQSAVDALLAMGLPGIVIGGLCWWIFRQDNRYFDLQKKSDDALAALQRKYDELSAKRGDEAQRMALEALEVGDVIKRQTEILLELKAGMKR